jgi:arsenate reductase
MAEGWTRDLRGGLFEVGSAGIEARGVDPRAVAVMAEAGVDISSQRSERLDEIGTEWDYVVTVCSHAEEACPAFPGRVLRLHVAFDDPPRLAAGARDEELALSHYRRVRDEIRGFVETLPGALDPGH